MVQVAAITLFCFCVVSQEMEHANVKLWYNLYKRYKTLVCLSVCQFVFTFFGEKQIQEVG